MDRASPSQPNPPTTVGQATTSDLVELWRGFLTSTSYLEPGRKVSYDARGRPQAQLPTYTDRIRELAHIFPQQRSLEVPFEEVDDFSPTLGAAILTRAQDTVQAAEMAVFEELPEADRERVEKELQTKLTIGVEVTQIPKEEVGIEVRYIRKEHLNKLISVKVLVRKAMEVRPRVTLGYFRCEWERHPNRLAQDFFMFREPRLCRERDCKCSDFRFIPERSIYVDSQMLEVQEFPESLPAGAQPERLVVYAEDTLAARIMPGDRVVINGILRQRQKRKGGQPLTTFDIYLHAISMDERVTEFEDLIVTDEEREQIHETATAPRLRQRIVGSIAPSIFGMQMEKTAIALLLFGGVSKRMPDGNRIRGDIHMLLVGDPGVAKSQLLRYVSRLAPRGILASGKSATAAGLCVAPETLITLSNGELMEIGPFIESRMSAPQQIRPGVWRQATNGYKMLTVNRDLRLQEQKLQAVWRLESPRRLYEITTRTNRRLTVSAETPLPVYDSGGINWVKAAEIGAEMHLATPRRLAEPKNPIPFTIELIDENSIIAGAGELVRQILEKLKVKYLTKREIARHFDLDEGKLYYNWVNDKHQGNPTLGELLRLGREVGISHAQIAPYVKCLSQFHGHRITLPERVTPQLCYFAGLVAADGAVSRMPSGGYAIRFSSSDPQLMENFRDLCHRCFSIEPHITSGSDSRPPEARFNSKIVASLLERMGVPTSPRSNRLDIGKLIQKLPNTHLGPFFKGLFDCDGSCNSRRDGGGSTIELYTTSRLLATKAQILLMRFGIIAKVRERKNAGRVTPLADGVRSITSKHEIYVLTLYGRKNLALFSQYIGFSHPRKRENLHRALTHPTNDHSNWDNLPQAGKLFREVRLTYGIPAATFGRLTRFESGAFNPSRNYLRNLLVKLETMIDEKAYWGRGMAIPAALRTRLTHTLRAHTSVHELATIMGLSEYRIYELLLRKGRNPPLPALLVSKLCSLLRRWGEESLSRELARSAGLTGFAFELERSGELLTKLHRLLESDIFWDRVDKVEVVEKGLEYIYDLSVEESHNFLANGLLAHNTAAAVRDEFGDGRWTLEAGALVMADGGVACIDEIDKMTESDRASMHEAMEQQTISVAKAGITAELQARCSVLGAANPKYGRFDETQSLHSQINMPPTLLSRFDVIFTIADKPMTERDQALAHHILEEHYAGELLRQEEQGLLDDEGERLARKVKQNIAPALSGDFLRKYLAVARRESIPVLSDAARDRLQRYYVHMRALSAKEGGYKISITPRQLEAMVRLAEASAKMHLRQQVDEEDAQLAIDILEHFLEHVAGGDVDSFMSDHSAQERASDPRVIMLRTLQELAAVASEGLVEEEELILEATKKGLHDKKARQVFSVLREEGTILESQGRFYAY